MVFLSLSSPLTIFLPVLFSLVPSVPTILCWHSSPGFHITWGKGVGIIDWNNGWADSGARRGPWAARAPSPPARPEQQAGAFGAKRNWADVVAGRSEVRPKNFLIAISVWRRSGRSQSHSSFLEGKKVQMYSVLTWRGLFVVSEAPSTMLGPKKCLVNVMGG